MHQLGPLFLSKECMHCGTFEAGTLAICCNCWGRRHHSKEYKLHSPVSASRKALIELFMEIKTDPTYLWLSAHAGSGFSACHLMSTQQAVFRGHCFLKSCWWYSWFFQLCCYLLFTWLLSPYSLYRSIMSQILFRQRTVHSTWLQVSIWK